MGTPCSYDLDINGFSENIIEVFVGNVFGVSTFKVEVKERFVVDVYSGWEFIAKGAIVGDILKFPSPIV